ncbi:hypothetical protein ETAA1_09200 [Urbifossiella limnaea]|uniref:Uncharacterized protein n=1 Tax=Urbifossiella limnaea TaxID=2528023 RepID=A0A517XND4_9BACT|nr:hypothetical protein [Urbifossiella limnaea]QDU19018.1 hypothetical protein ETAA1_09200 [Urbifossiella limnaea]
MASTTPAGNISHMARGRVSFCTNSARVAAPVAPPAATRATASADRSWATQVCPPRSSRSTMNPPIRPSPIIPSWITTSLFRDAREHGPATRVRVDRLPLPG